MSTASEIFRSPASEHSMYAVYAGQPALGLKVIDHEECCLSCGLVDRLTKGRHRVILIGLVFGLRRQSTTLLYFNLQDDAHRGFDTGATDLPVALRGVSVADGQKRPLDEDRQEDRGTLCLLFIHPRAPNLIGLRSAGTMPA